MASLEEVQLFLQDFHQKMKVWEIRFRDDRGKNFQALLILEISGAERIKIIESISANDYSQGPIPDTLNAGAPLWIFGKLVKSKMVYIKISMGVSNKPVIYISFHEAEYEMRFPFKDNYYESQ